jgi:non-specific serine/threonine protein kinase/serine/threonine-protein kinase
MTAPPETPAPPATRARPDLLPQTWYRLKGVFAEALERGPRERDGFVAAACGDDAELRAQVTALLRAHAVDDSFLLRPAAAGLGWANEDADPSWIGRRIGHYRIVAQAGRGGLSYVFRAVRDDGEFAQQVAIKLLRPEAGNSVLLARFHAERRVLATLAHPNVAHFLDGGTTDDGRPYLVMEFVEGEPIDEWCDARGLGLDARLELFRTLCAAVHYVHQNLVVHGDLKGGNVLVTRDGVVKLVDFGIAKLLDPGGGSAAPRAATLLLMTPEYASPEQLRGEGITTASDVYSLGAVLYRLLTGTTPYGGGVATPVSIAERMASGELRLPSVAAARSPGLHAQFAKALRGDLDTIVLKALKAAAGERYGSAQQLGDDVQRHLRGLPVEARPDSAGYRIAKFARRHSAATAATVLALVSLLAGTAVAVWQARAASAERARAERHFAAVRTLSTTYVGDVYDAIVQIPGTTAARKLLLDRSLEYLTALERDAGDSIELQRDLAKAWERLGDVQGGYLRASLADTGAAVASYRRALAIRERLFAREPTVQHRLDLLWTQGDLAALLLATDAFDEARPVIEAAVRNADLALAEGATGPLVGAVAEAYVNQGWLQRVDGRMDSAIGSLERALAVAERMVAEAPEDMTARQALVIAFGRIGDAYVRGFGDHERALPYYRRAHAVLDELARDNPGNLDIARGRSFARVTIGELLTKAGRPEEALREIEPELLALDRARRADPTDVLARLGYGAALNRAGEARLGLARYEAADRDFIAAASYLGPELVEAGTELAVIHGQALAGRARALAGQAAARRDPGAEALRAQARDYAVRAIAVLEPLTKGGNEALEATRLLAECRRVLEVTATPARSAAR